MDLLKRSIFGKLQVGKAIQNLNTRRNRGDNRPRDRKAIAQSHWSWNDGLQKSP